MKKHEVIKKIAVKGGTFDGDIFKDLIEKRPGVKKVFIEPGLIVYLMDDKMTVEIYGEGVGYPDYLFSQSNIVVSFKVDDIDKMITAFRQMGAIVLGKIESECASYKYCHLLTKENTVLGLYECS